MLAIYKIKLLSNSSSIQLTGSRFRPGPHAPHIVANASASRRLASRVPKPLATARRAARTVGVRQRPRHSPAAPPPLELDGFSLPRRKN